MPFDCPNCSGQTNRLIADSQHKKVVCPNCYERPKASSFNYQLHQRVESDRGVRITLGKAFEIDNRTLASDGKTVINRVTGKEAQF